MMKQYVYNYGTSSISAKRAWAAVFSRTLLNAQALGMLIERVYKSCSGQYMRN